MPCVLCLRVTNGRNRRIELASAQADEWDIKMKITLHFWRQIKNGPESTDFICKSCWNSLSTFHQFYLSIENAYASMKSVMPIEESPDVKGFEPEPVLIPFNINQTEIENAQPAKRKRGRPRRQPPSMDPSIDTLIPLSEDIDRLGLLSEDYEKESRDLLEDVLGEIKLNEIKIELPEPDDTLTDVLDENVALQNLVDIALSENTPVPAYISESEESPHVSSYKSKRIIQKKSPKKAKKTTKKNSFKNTKIIKRKSVQEIQERTKKMKENDEFLKAHIKLKCSMCTEGPFTDFAHLLAHIRKEHNQRGFMVCCGRKHYRRGLLVDHLITHEHPDYFKCSLCGQVVGERRSLELHMKMHDSKQIGRIHKCEVCSKSFYNEVILKRHMLMHLPAEERKIPCTECDKTFPCRYVMKQHYYRIHLNKYAKICEICGKSIQGNEALERHMQEHALGKRLLLTCEICGATLTNKWGLARHNKMMHTEENLKPMKCPICPKISASLQAHQTHIKFSHNTERKHQCPMCDKAFKRPKVLREHMTIHTGDVLYTCPHCPRTFNSNANLHSHRKKKHRAEWEANRRHRFVRDAQKVKPINIDSTTTVTTNNKVEVNENLKEESLLNENT